MYSKATTKFYWQNMCSDIQNYVSSCKLCCQNNTGHDPKVALHSVQVANHPSELIHADILQIHSISNRYKYILVLICAFSKLVITVPLRNKAAPTVAEAIFENLFLRYGYIKHLSCISDNGLDMINAWTKSLYEIMGVKCIRTSPYKPSSDGQVERTNRQILSILRKFTIDDPKKWSKNLQLATAAINSSTSESTQFTQFFLTHGVEMTSVLDLVLPQPNEYMTRTNKQAISHWSLSIERIRKYVRENIIDAKQKQKKYYDVHTRKHSFKVGDLGYIKIHHWPSNSDTKLKPRYKGIYKITKFISDTNVIVEDEGANPHRTARKPKASDSELVDSTESSEDGTESTSDENESTSDENESTSDENESLSDENESLSDENESLDMDIDQEEKGVNNEDYSRIDEENIKTEDEVFIDGSMNEICNSGIIKNQEDQDTDGKSSSEDQNNRKRSESSEVHHQNNHEHEVPDNCPTEEYFLKESTPEPLEPIKKVIKQRVTSDETRQVYVSWKKHPVKKDRQWIHFSDLSPELQIRVNTWKKPIKQSINAITIKLTSEIICSKADFLSFYYRFDTPIQKPFKYKDISFIYKAYSMDELYTFFEHMIVGNYENLVDIIRNDNNVNKSTQIPQSRPPYWKYITPILIYHIVKQVLKHNIKVENKLNQTEGMCITEKGLGVTAVNQ